MTTTSQYFVVNGSGITIDGAGYKVTISRLQIYGLVENGKIDEDGFSNCTIKNIGIVSTPSFSTASVPIVDWYFGKGQTDCSISNCYAIVVGDLDGAGIAGSNNSGSISNCYVIVKGYIDGAGIVGNSNSGTISNCYVVAGGNIGGGIAKDSNSGTISNCYVIVGGNIIRGGIVCTNNSNTISNCYVICGGNIGVSSSNIPVGGISGGSNYGAISNCYVICGGDITYGGGIAGLSQGTISNCYVDTSSYSYFFAHDENVNGGTDNQRGNSGAWSSTGADKLLAGIGANAWINIDTTNNATPYLLSAFNTALTTDTMINSTSGTLSLTSYGLSLANVGELTSLSGGTFTYSNDGITYSGMSSGTYTLTIYAYNLLSNLSSFAFTFTKDDEIEAAYNVTSTDGSTANTIVPYMYSCTTVSINISINVGPSLKTELYLVEGVDPITGRSVWKLNAKTELK